MPNTLHFRAIPSLSRCSLLSNTVVKFSNCFPRSIFAPNATIFGIRTCISPEVQTRNHIICARKKRMRIGSKRSSKLMLELVSVIASNLKILPEPLDLVIREFGGAGGQGGGVGFWKGFGGGGGFDGWRRKKKSNIFIFIGIFVVCGFVLLIGTELEINVVCGVLGIALSSVALIQWLKKRGITDLIWGLCLWGILMGLGLRRMELQKWVERARTNHPLVKIVRRTRGRRAF